jgi:phage shock protein PspC (stress-responsive transcriptional regulator)
MKKLHRSVSDRWLAGVFSGLADAMEIDPNLVRLAAIFLGLATGILPMLITYLVAWCVVPQGQPVQQFS